MMRLRIGKAALPLFLLLLVPAALHAQDQDTKVSVTALPNPVPEHESLQLQVTVDSPLSAPVVQPSFDASEFTLMGAAGLSYAPIDSAAGPNTRKKVTFTFVLMPKKAGEFSIRNIQTKVGKEVRMAPDVRVQVLAGGQPTRQSQGQLKSPTDSDDDASNPASPSYRGGGQPSSQYGSRTSSGPTHPLRFNSDFTVHAVLSKQKAYVGEPVVVEYYLYDYGHVRHADVLKWPTFNGFWKEDLHLTTQVAFEEVFVQNQEMRRAFLARYALYGIKPGKLDVDKLGIRGKYLSDDSLSPGLVFGFDLRTGQHFSQDLSLELLPLPEAGRPANYGGAVGQFSLKLEANKQSVPASTPITFTMTLTGIGNFQAIDSIKLPLPPDFELYESTSQGRIVAPIGTKQDLESKKTFQVIAIPRKSGKFEVPAVSWSFFNPEKAAYETLTTEPMSIEVTEGGASSENASNNYLKPEDPKNGQKIDNEFRLLKSVTLDSPVRLNFLSWALIILFAVNLFLLFTKLRAKWRGLFSLVRSVDRFAEARISLLQAKGIKDSEWQAGLEEVVLMTMQVLLETNPRGLTKNDLEENWKSRNLPLPLFQRMIALLDEIDRHRFSSQKLSGSGTKEMRSRLTKETESLLIEASRAKRK